MGLHSIEASYAMSVKEIKELIIDNESPGADDINITKSYSRSTKTLGSYVTLDWKHKTDIIAISKKIKDYSTDRTQRRPLNFLMIAEPGSGKSHFVKCLANKLSSSNVRAVTYNMSTFEKPEDLIHSLEIVRNLKVQDILPILFIDEFDSDKNKYSFLLPLLWDGEMQLSNRNLNLGKIVIILAGSKDEIGKAISDTKKMEEEIRNNNNSSKLKDLLSRINGGDFEIPKLDTVKGNRDRRVDKICLTISLLQQRFGQDLQLVPWALLKFISNTKFRYGVRSIAQLIDLIPFSADCLKKITAEDLKLPLKSTTSLKGSSLPYHLLTNDAEEIVERWNKAIMHKTLVRFVEDFDDDPI